MLKESNVVDSYYDYICIIDFEVICEEGNLFEFIYEIIEFFVVLLNIYILEIVSELLYFNFILVVVLEFVSKMKYFICCFR